MNRTQIIEKPYVSSSEILVIGFENDVCTSLNEFLNGNSRPIKAVNTHAELAEVLHNYNGIKPFAILCKFEFLELDDFSILRTIRFGFKLHDVPLVTTSHQLISLSASEALKIGIDDNFVEPVDWQVINHRLVFLNRFKKLNRPILHLAHDIIPPVKIPFYRRLFDITLAISILILMSPVLLLIAIGIKLESPGPVLYVSSRIGTNYRIFDFLKFRTMKAYCDSNLNERIEGNIYMTEDPYFYKFKNDPRVTKIGRLLRKTSLDEMPQLINVIKGEMSIVGNRPLPVYEARKLTSNQHALRFFAPAGITGLWQVAPEGKENISQNQRIKFDIQYAQKNTMLLDMKIIAKTLPAMLQRGE